MINHESDSLPRDQDTELACEKSAEEGGRRGRQSGQQTNVNAERAWSFREGQGIRHLVDSVCGREWERTSRKSWHKRHGDQAPPKAQNRSPARKEASRNHTSKAGFCL